MRTTILVDQNVFEFLSSEFGFSCYIEIDGLKLLFDTGFSNIFLKNALKLEINLHDIDGLILSHGHHDHSWGLAHLVQSLMQQVELQKKIKKPKFYCCPGALEPKWMHGGHQYGCLLNKETIASFFDINTSNEPIWITKNLVFLGKIERTFDFEETAYKENGLPGKVMINGRLQEDLLLDDSAIACKTNQGLVIITGCSHSGICNIIEHAKKVCNEHRIVDIIGGFHLMNADKNRLDKICEYFKKLNPKAVHVCHCTDFKAKEKLARITPVQETGVGLVIEH